MWIHLLDGGVGEMPEVIVVMRKGSKEFLNLVESLGYKISQTVEFKDAKNPKFYISEGKVDEIKHLISGKEKVIVDGILKSSQWYNLEKELKTEVEDRIKLIIDIFADRAKSREAKLQVEYALLKYRVPLIREVIHHVRMGEHAGWMGAGEYEIADYYEMIRRRMTRIERKLKKISVEREERRKERKRNGFILVGIAGYTNVGKSTLLNRLTESGVIVEERMFSTLSTKTSRLGKERILITDTVGFVADMPPWLIEAFRPTLEEIYNADIVLLLLDGAEDVGGFQSKMNVTLDVLLNKVRGKIIPVINKIDLASSLEDKIEIAGEIGDVVCISAKNGAGINGLIKRIEREAGLKRYTAIMENFDKDVFAMISRYAKIESIQYGRSMAVKFVIQENMMQELKRKLERRGIIVYE